MWGILNQKNCWWQTFYSFFRNKVFTYAWWNDPRPKCFNICHIFGNSKIWSNIIQNIQLQLNIVWVEQFCIKFHKKTNTFSLRWIFIAMNSLFTEQYNFTRSFHQSLTSQFCNFLVQNCPLMTNVPLPPVTTYIHTKQNKLHPPRKRIYNKYCFSSLKNMIIMPLCDTI